MPTDVTLEELRQLMDKGAQVVEVLASDQFKNEHIPGAVNIPLQEIDKHSVMHLDPAKPVVVYCFDYT